MVSNDYLRQDVKDKLNALLEIVRSVVPTREGKCPLKEALNDYDQAVDDLDHRLWKNRVGL